MEFLSHFNIPIVSIFRWMIQIVCLLWLHTLLLAMYPKVDKILQNILVLVVFILSTPFIVQAFEMMQQLVSIITTFIESIIPILIALFSFFQAVFSLGAWSPTIILIANSFIFLCEKLLLPALLVVFIFQMISRISPQISLFKAATFLRRTILSVISISMFLITSVVAVSTSAIASISTFGQTTKRILEQNIPLIGSLLNDGILMMKNFLSIPVTISGAVLIGTMLVSISIPVIKLLIISISFFLMGAVAEPLGSGQVSNLLDDIGRVLLVMCGVAVVVALSFVFNGFLIFLFLQWVLGRSL